MKVALDSFNVIGLKLFTYGFIGVDVFFFFSAFGCCFSYKKNRLLMFYLRRIIRIMPLFVIWALVHLYYMHYLKNVSINIDDVIYCLTTVSYYGIGSVRSNWYLSALIAFYLTFPLLYLLVRKIKAVAVLGILAVSIVLEFFFQFEWYHETFIGRFSIFSFGIVVYFVIKDKKYNSLIQVMCGFILASFLIIIFRKYLLIPEKNWLSIIATCVSPILILILSFFFFWVQEFPLLKKVLDFFGKHSLEFFIGNCWTMLLMNETTSIDGFYSLMAIYLSSNAIFGLCLIPVNNLLTKWIDTCLNCKAQTWL